MRVARADLIHFASLAVQNLSSGQASPDINPNKGSDSRLKCSADPCGAGGGDTGGRAQSCPSCWAPENTNLDRTNECVTGLH